MKFLKSLFLLFAINLVVLTAYAQDKVSLMYYPKDWRYEKILLPLDFAKDITWKGFEELRFSPGMFKDTAPDYFTYYFGILIDNKTNITTTEIKEMLEKYYRGLCKAVNSKGKFSIDYSAIKANVTKEKEDSFKAEVVFFDPFTDGKKLNLEMLMSFRKMKGNKLLLLTSVTPAKNGQNLQELHKKNCQHNFPKN